MLRRFILRIKKSNGNHFQIVCLYSHPSLFLVINSCIFQRILCSKNTNFSVTASRFWVIYCWSNRRSVPTVNFWRNLATAMVREIISVIFSSALLCCALASIPLSYPTFPSNYQNEMDRLLFVIGKSSDGNIAPFCGLESRHLDSFEDRQFKWASCSINDPNHNTVVGYNPLPQTSFDGTWTRTCPHNHVLAAVASEHVDQYEDRIFSFGCMRFAGTKVGHCTNNGYVNDMDEHFTFRCGPNQVITEISSYHHNSFEDRRFKFTCCTLEHL